MIDDTTARRIASEWHGGGGSPLYQLSSTGAITVNVNVEIHSCLSSTRDFDDLSDLERLNDYCLYHGVRGEQEGWGKLSW